jgi:hypothetical protein
MKPAWGTRVIAAEDASNLDTLFEGSLTENQSGLQGAGGDSGRRRSLNQGNHAVGVFPSRASAR